MKIGGNDINDIKIGSVAVNKVVQNGITYWQSFIDPSSYSDLSYWAKGRSGLIIPDDFGNDAQILPAVFKGNGSAYYRRTSANYYSSDDWTLYLDVEFFSTPGATITFLSQGFGPLTFQYLSTGNWSYSMTDGTNTRSITITAANLPTQNRKYSFKITHSKTDTTKIYEGGVEKGSASGTYVNTQPANCFFASKGEGSAWMNSNSGLISARLYSDLTETNLVYSYIFTGNYVSDISGNNRNLTSMSVVSANTSFSVNGSLYLLDSGWALWQKSGSSDIHIPFGGIAIAPVVGYTLTKNYEGSLTKLNMAPCLIGFNETSSSSAALEIFDRSNVTRQTSTSRSSSYYDSTNLATKCRYHISEVYPYEVFKTLFESDYQDKVFTAISKSGSDFSLTDFVGYSIKKTGIQLFNIKTWAHIDELLTVGLNKNVRTISQAIERAYDDYTITIDIGTYNEYLDLTSKRVDLIGLGTLETIICYEKDGSNNPSTVDIAKNCTFTNLVFDGSGISSHSDNPIVHVSSASPLFTSCKILHEYTTQQISPLVIENASTVTMTNSSIEVANSGILGSYVMIVKDTSVFNFSGTKFMTQFIIKDDAVASIITDEMWATNTGSLGIRAENNSEVYLTINNRQVACDSLGIENATGSYNSKIFYLYDNARVELSGNQIVGATVVNGDNNNVLFKDIVSTFGHFWVVTVGSLRANNVLITFDNCQINLDCDSDSTGLHIIEDEIGAEVRIINNSRLEFTGHEGNWFTMGNPITLRGKLYIRDSEIIDNCNDNIPYGTNYPQTIKASNDVDLENVIITNQNWDGVGVNKNIVLQKLETGNLIAKLKNVVFNNSEINTPPVELINYGDAFNENDYISIDNVINNSTADICSNMSSWNILIGNSPEV